MLVAEANEGTQEKMGLPRSYIDFPLIIYKLSLEFDVVHSLHFIVCMLPLYVCLLVRKRISAECAFEDKILEITLFVFV